MSYSWAENTNRSRYEMEKIGLFRKRPIQFIEKSVSEQKMNYFITPKIITDTTTADCQKKLSSLKTIAFLRREYCPLSGADNGQPEKPRPGIFHPQLTGEESDASEVQFACIDRIIRPRPDFLSLNHIRGATIK